MIIRLEHMRQMPLAQGRTGYCSKGARLFAERNGLDWESFCRDGIDEAVLLATGDYQAQQVVEFAHQLEGVDCEG
jgi:hypothetical protein